MFQNLSQEKKSQEELSVTTLEVAEAVAVATVAETEAVAVATAVETEAVAEATAVEIVAETAVENVGKKYGRLFGAAFFYYHIVIRFLKI